MPQLNTAIGAIPDILIMNTHAKWHALFYFWIFTTLIRTSPLVATSKD